WSEVATASPLPAWLNVTVPPAWATARSCAAPQVPEERRMYFLLDPGSPEESCPKAVPHTSAPSETQLTSTRAREIQFRLLNMGRPPVLRLRCRRSEREPLRPLSCFGMMAKRRGASPGVRASASLVSQAGGIVDVSRRPAVEVHGAALSHRWSRVRWP